MELYLIVVLAFGLSMDAFAISLTNGMCYRMPVLKNAFSSAAAFGAAQAIMPLIGYFAGHTFSSIIGDIDHWLALVLLSFIGGKMIWEARKERQNGSPATMRAFSGKMLCMQAVATSIDALAVGVGLGVMQVNVYAAVSIIGAITFVCCFAGVLLGRRFGRLFQDKAELLGGAILIFIGIRIFLEHMELLPF